MSFSMRREFWEDSRCPEIIFTARYIRYVFSAGVRFIVDDFPVFANG